MTIRRNNDVRTPNLGLYLGMSHTSRPTRAMVACQNVRIRQGKVIFDNLGWGEFPDAVTPVNLDNKPVMLIGSFELRNGSNKTIFGNTTDLFVFTDATGAINYLSERYEVGTATVTNGSAVVTGTGTLWDTADNVKAGDMYSHGATETDPAAVWYEIASVDSDTQITLTANYAEATDGPSVYTVRKTFTGAIQNPWITEPFYNGAGLGGASPTGDRIYFTNTIDAIVAWDGSADAVYTPNLGNVETCVWLKQHKNKMVYVAPTVGGAFEKFSIRTSDIGNPEDTVTGEAVELIVHDGPDQLLAAFPIGEQLALYSEENITVAQSVSLPFVYVFRTVVTGYGPISGRGISVYPDFHDFVAEDRQYRFNGASATPVNDHIWRDILRRVTPERNSFLHSHFDDAQGELMWAVPLTTDADTEDGPVENSYVAHYMEDVSERFGQPHTQRELPALVFGSYFRQTTLTWDQISSQWQDFNFRWNDKFFFAQFPVTLWGDVNGNVFSLNTLNTKNGTAMDAFARFSRIATGSVEVTSVIRRIYPYLEEVTGSTDTVQVRLYGTNNIEGNVTLLSDQAISTGLDGSTRFVSPRKSARFVEIEIGNDAKTNYWAMAGYGVDAVKGGSR